MLDPPAPTPRDCDDPLAAVLGVIDLKQGRAVHAVRGQRASYQPVCCDATANGDPIRLAQMYIDAGVGGLYIADLDAIMASSPNTQQLNQIVQLGLPIWIDAGTIDLQLPNTKNTKNTENTEKITRVIGTESIASLDDLEPLRDRWSVCGHDLAVSIDLQDGRILADSDELASLAVDEIAAGVVDRGICQLIVLDLAAVGAEEGPKTEQICRRIADQHPRVRLISGGGIRSLTDTENLKRGGCRYVLVGTALHGGRKKFLFAGGTC